MRGRRTTWKRSELGRTGGGCGRPNSSRFGYTSNIAPTQPSKLSVTAELLSSSIIFHPNSNREPAFVGSPQSGIITRVVAGSGCLAVLLIHGSAIKSHSNCQKQKDLDISNRR